MGKKKNPWDTVVGAVEHPADFSHNQWGHTGDVINETASDVGTAYFGGVGALGAKKASAKGTSTHAAAMGDPGSLQQAWKGGGEKRKADAAASAAAKTEQLYKNTQDYNSGLDASGQKYLDQMDDAHNDSSKVYSQTVKPNLQNLMERAHQDSDSSMSLKDAMDPLNNKVGAGTRKFYNDQADNEGRSGLAATSLASSLGMQNMAGQMGSMGPMSGGQLAALMGQNQAMAGQAFGQTQRRQQSLRDTGIDKAYQRSDLAYNQGLDAQDRFGHATGEYDNAASRQRGLDEANYGLHNAMGNQSIFRKQAADTARYGGDMSNINAQIAAENAKDQRTAEYGKAGIKAGSTAIGAYVGGPQGAAAGNAAGGVAADEAIDSPEDDDGQVEAMPASGTAPHAQAFDVPAQKRQGARSLNKYIAKRGVKRSGSAADQAATDARNKAAGAEDDRKDQEGRDADKQRAEDAAWAKRAKAAKPDGLSLLTNMARRAK
jgi:hypothetical protein